MSSPVGSSQSNGFIERAIQYVEGQIRTMKLDFESHLGEKIPSDHNSIPWLVEYAAVLINRGQVGKDGKTAYERLKGKPASLPGMQFGEKMLWRTNVPARDRKNRMDSQTSEGIYLGQRTVSGECLVGSSEGVFRPRTVYRVPVENRWKENLSLAKGLPWKLNAEHEAGEEVILDTYMPEPSPKPKGTPLPPVTLEEKLKKAKQFYVKQKDLDPAQAGLGWTPGCKGCESIAGKHPTQVAHSDECRLRVIEKTKSNPVTAARLKASELREKEYHAKKLEEAHGPRHVEVEVVSEAVPEVVPEAPRFVGRTPAQEGGSSGSGGALPVAGRLSPAGVPGPPDMQVDHDSRKRGFAQRTADHRASRAALQDGFGDDAEEMRQRGRRLREEATVPMALTAGSSKPGPDGQGDREKTKRVHPPIDAEPMEDAPIPLDLELGSAVKRMAQEDTFNEYGPDGHGGDEKKGARYSHPTIDAVDAVEGNHLMLGRL